MTRINRSRRGLFAGLLLVASIAGGALVTLDASAGRVADRSTVIHWYPVTDLGDDRKLAGLGDDVFLGTVLAEAGFTAGVVPETQYRVRVAEALKGDLAGEILVNQQGGRPDGHVVVMEGDTLLSPGVTYLFVTRRNRAAGFHTVVPAYGDLPVSSPGEAAALVSRFRSAVTNQIAYRP